MKFNLKGYNTNNLLKTLYIKKIPLHNVVMLSHNQVSFETDEKYENKIKRYIKNFDVEKTPKLFKRFPKFIYANLGIILAVFFGILFFIFVSNFTWKISIYGTKDLTEQDIIQVLKNNGVKTGKINLQSSEDIETILLNNYDRIAQVSVIKKGTHIIINLSEKLVYVEEKFEPLIANYSGIITDINVITGTINVKIGDYVNKGDVLVLPFNINANGEQISVKPIAQIKAKIFLIYTNKIKQQEIVLKRTNKTSICYAYKLFNFKLFKGKNKNKFKHFETEIKTENVSSLVPLKRDVIKYYELAPTTISHNLEQEKTKAEEEALKESYKLLPDVVDNLTENVVSTIQNDELVIVVNLEAESIIC